MEGRIIYFDTPGKVNTDITFRVACQRAQELGINQSYLTYG